MNGNNQPENPPHYIVRVIGGIAIIGIVLSFTISNDPVVGVVRILIALFATYILVAYIIRAANRYINAPDADTSSEQSEGKSAYQPEYIDDTVHYTLQRIGSDSSFSLSDNRKRGRFVIEGDRVTAGNFAFGQDDIRRFTRQPTNNIVTLDLDVNGWWYMLTIEPGYGGEQFVEAMQGIVPDHLETYIPHDEMRTVKLLSATMNKSETVELAITPLWLVVFQNGRVIRTHSLTKYTNLHIEKAVNAMDDTAQTLTITEETDTKYTLTDMAFIERLQKAIGQPANDIDHPYDHQKKSQSS